MTSTCSFVILFSHRLSPFAVPKFFPSLMPKSPLLRFLFPTSEKMGKRCFSKRPIYLHFSSSPPRFFPPKNTNLGISPCHCATSLSPKCANSIILTPIYIRSLFPSFSLLFRFVQRDKTHHISSCYAVIAEPRHSHLFSRPFLIPKREKSPENQAFSCLYSMYN